MEKCENFPLIFKHDLQTLSCRLSYEKFIDLFVSEYPLHFIINIHSTEVVMFSICIRENATLYYPGGLTCKKPNKNLELIITYKLRNNIVTINVYPHHLVTSYL